RISARDGPASYWRIPLVSACHSAPDVALTALYMLPAKLFLMTSGGFAQMRLEHLLPFHRMLCDHHHASSTQILLTDLYSEIVMESK
ncbi:hypothetical protein L9F63_023318, partial [Diploptera punctata]